MKFPHPFREEYLPLGTLNHYLLHFPAGEPAPVLLFLHGGPGVAESNLGYLYRKWWGELFTVVHWDQPGAGKTLLANPAHRHHSLTLAGILEDLHRVVAHLQALYKTPKIALLGHSWGSLLGALYTLAHPENVGLCIGVGQVVNLPDNEAVGYARLRQEVAQEGTPRQKERLAALEAAGPYPPPGLTMAQARPLIQKVKRLEQEMGLVMRMNLSLARDYFRGPTARPADILPLLGSGQRANAGLREELWRFDLRRHPARYEAPLCYILGERDFQTPTLLAQAYLEEVDAPAKELFILPGAGHNTMYDAPDAFARVLHKTRALFVPE